MSPSTAANRNDDALSEVIGFVLILGIITAAFSLYLVYGVPAQGRENEINHMNDIKDQFVSYKIGVDSLWTNQQVGTAMSTSFPLGTAGQTTQGSTSIIPVLQPVGSSGTLGINQRTTTPENFTISSTSYITNTSATTSDPPISITPSLTVSHTYPNAPSQLLITLQTASQYDDPNPGNIKINGSNWSATINITRNVAECLDYTLNPTNVTSKFRTGCNGTDIALTVMKNSVKSLDRSVIYPNININTPYTINLLDPAYGLQSAITYPETMTFSEYNPSGNLSMTTATAQYSYEKQSNYSYTVPLGALTYNAKNNYWISQTYYYQMGGVFLSQSDGITYKLPPEITFLNNGNRNISINIVALAYDPANAGIVGGNSPAQVSTSLKSDAGPLPYAAISPNTWSTISILTPDPNAATMWKNYLNTTANQTGGIPYQYYTTGSLTNGSYIQFNSANWTSDGYPHITLNVKTANLSVSVHGVGGALQ